MAKTMTEVLVESEKVEPLAEVNGMKVVSFEEAQTLNQAELMKKELGQGGETGDRTFNPDGSVARSKTKVAAVNYDSVFSNRYRLVKKRGESDCLEVVVDYRAIKEQERGQIYVQRIQAYVIKRDEDKNLVLDHITTVSDRDFISEFTHKLNADAMKEILPLITEGGKEISTDEILI